MMEKVVFSRGVGWLDKTKEIRRAKQLITVPNLPHPLLHQNLHSLHHLRPQSSCYAFYAITLLFWCVDMTVINEENKENVCSHN